MRKRTKEEQLLEVIRKWKFHWMLKEPGYEERGGAIDSNMMHHLAKMLVEPTPLLGDEIRELYLAGRVLDHVVEHDTLDDVGPEFEEYENLRDTREQLELDAILDAKKS